MIEVGEYVRTREGYIDKITIAENEFDMYAGEKNPQYLDYTSEDIIKHSKNIIDLIEVGDYVNGNIVYEVLDDEVELLSGKIRKKRLHFITGHLIDEDEIKSIITKEKMEEMEYKVKE